MNHIYRIYSYFDKEYLKRAYVIGGMFFVIMGFPFIVGLMHSKFSLFDRITNVFFAVAYFSILTLLFPFSKMLWDNMKSFVIGNTSIVMSVFILFPVKFVVNGFLWAMSLFIGPVGIAYAWYKTK